MDRLASLTAGALSAIAVSTFGIAPALAEYPDKPITVLIGSRPGGSLDSMGRILSTFMEKELEQARRWRFDRGGDAEEGRAGRLYVEPGIFGAMLIANFVNLFLGSAGLRFFAFVISLPHRYIHPVIVLLCICGAFLTGQSMLAIALMLFFAVLGYVMRKLDFSIVAFIIAFILGPMFEDSLRQTIVLFEDNPGELLTQPITVLFVLLTFFSIYRLGFRKAPEIMREP